MKKRLSLASLICTTVFYAASPAFADDGFYLEIGKKGSEEEVAAQWKEISSKYKKLLGSLTFYPKTITDDSGNVSHVIQVGMLEKKQTAQKICAQLFAKKVSCFVIEGIENSPPSSIVGFSRMTTQLELAKPATPTTSEITSTPQVLGQISSPADTTEEVKLTPATEDKPEAKKEILVQQAGEAKVDVAQAIPVPLSEDKTAEEQPTVIPSVSFNENSSGKIVPVAPPHVPKSGTVAMKDLPAVEFSSGSAGWLSVSAFTNETEANKLWNEVRSKSPDETAGLRGKIQKSLARASANPVQLIIGPFPDSSDANNFCSNNIISVRSSLKCSFEGSELFSPDNVAETPVKYEHTNAYEERRKSLRKTANKSIDQLSVTVHEDGESSKFWAQVVIADSKNEAKKRLDDIKSANKDILEGVSANVLNSGSRHGKYNARLGPLATEQAANELCDILQQRSIDCLTVATK